MRFRFTISRSDKLIDPLPNFDTWQNRGLDDRIPWVIGSAPEVDLPGTGFSDIKISDELYTEYNFIPGEEYTITVEYTRVINVPGSNPRHMRLYIYSDLFVLQHQVTDTTPTEPTPLTRSFSLTFTADSNCKIIALYYASGCDVSITLDDIDSDVTLTGVNSYQINEPDGWKDSTLKLERDKLFHSLIEHFEGSFIFYGDNGRINGGYHILKEWDLQDGPDADITLLIEYADDNVNFYELFSGQLDMSLAEWMIDHKVRIPIIKDEFWATFMNRKDTPVNLIADEDLDDMDVDELVDDISIDLPSQKIRYNGEYNWLDSFTYEFEEYNQEYAMQIDWDETIVDDVRKFTLPRAMVLDPGNDGVNTGENIVGIFEAPWDGDYSIDISFPFAFYNEDDSEWNQTSSVNFWMHGINDLPTSDDRFDRDTETNGDDSWNVFSLQRTFRASKGQQFKIYGTFAGPVTSGDLPRYTIFGERRLTWHNASVATTSSITLSGEQTIDGVLTSASVVLVRNQGDSSLNGLYISGPGAWTRHSAMDTASEFIDAAVYVALGDDNAGTAWRQTEQEIDLGSTAITWAYLLPNDERLRPFPEEVDNHFNITADTTFRKTRTAGFLLHDAAAAILKHYGLGEVNPFYSEVLGSDRTLARQYLQNGCFWPYGLTRGLQLRGYTLYEKSFAMSFMEWWQGADPIFNLGLGYEYIPENIVIPEETVVQDLADWTNAGGPNPGAWTFTSPNVPHTSANGNGGVTGYAQGECTTIEDETYEFTFELEIFDSGVSGEITEVTVAILDSLGNELDTEVFNYTDAGVKTETFTLTPISDGSYVAIRLQNDTPFDTKTYQLNQFVCNDEVEPIITPEETRIRVEKREYFYDPEPVVFLSNIRDITRRYDTEKIYKKILIGYKTWKTEDISGIDDPQTKHTYATQLRKAGEDVEVLSDFIAASLAIEQARRQSIDKSTDYQFDDNTFIIALNTDDTESSPDAFVPETDENFTVINNLLNSETRYNIRLTPKRSFLRHINWFNIGLQSYLGSFYRFTRGEGNYDVETAMLSSCDEEDYGGSLLGENDNLVVTSDAIHAVYYYEIGYKMSLSEYRGISVNKNKAIGVSQTDFGHIPFFIDTLSYKLAKGELQISGWTKEYWDITSIAGLPPTQDCTLFIPCENAITDENQNVLSDEEGNCIVWTL